MPMILSTLRYLFKLLLFEMGNSLATAAKEQGCESVEAESGGPWCSVFVYPFEYFFSLFHYQSLTAESNFAELASKVWHQ